MIGFNLLPFRLISNDRYKQLTIDHLTQSATKTAFDRRKALKYRYVWFLDLDGLKQINDKFGHDAGDRHIKNAIAELNCHFRRDTDYRVRWGGDEFLVFSNRPHLPALKYWSAGRALIDDLETAIAIADQEMYENKKRRKSNIAANS